jgi:chromosome segregation ATPase
MNRCIGLALILFFFSSSGIVEAQYRRHHRNSSYHRQAAVLVQQQRIQMVNTLQSQVALAHQVLANAESNSSMTQSKVYEAMSKLNAIQFEIESANDDVHKAFEEVRMIEADILADQADDSEFVKAKKAVEYRNEDVNHLVHRLAKLSDDDKGSSSSAFLEMSKLSESERQSVKSNPEYKSATDQVAVAEQHLGEIRKKLFEQSKEWRDAKRSLDKARTETRTETAKMKPAKMTAAQQNQQAQNLRNVIDNAKLVISQGELRLRQLGVNVKPSGSYNGKR